MNLKNNQKHSFHLVDPSPWPILGSFSALMCTFGGVLYMHGYIGGNSLLNLGFVALLLVMFGWWRDIVREATFEGQHTRMVQTGLRMGMILFIVSEIMFFVAFFWAFFHSSLNPSPFIGGVWPPAGLEVLNPWEVPLLNTVLLLSSGATVTWAHHAIVYGSRRQALLGLFFTLVLAVIFTALQGFEYIHAPFTMSDGIYGSTFYMLTGLHGFHVLIGTIFLCVALLRLICNFFNNTRFSGFELAIWYWHFVDVVWLLVFSGIYCWGNA